MLSGRIALVTGASRGIGAAAAIALAKAGAHTVLVARNVKGLEETDDAIRASGGTATLVELDLTDFPKIEMLAANIAQRFGKLDILVGNAGMLGELTPMQDLAAEDWQKVIDTNLTANWHLIRHFDALLKVSDAGRAMFVTSGVAKGARAYWSAYAVSKAALETMVTIYAVENEKLPLRVNLINPGQIRTRMLAKAFPGRDPQESPEPATIAELFVKLAQPSLQETGQTFSAKEMHHG